VKTACAGDRVDAGLVRGEEMHGVDGRRFIGPASLAQKRFLLVDRIRGLVHRVDADDEDLVVAAGLERRLREPRRQPMLDLRTHHRALVIDLGHHDGLVAKPTAEGAGPASLVGKDGGHRQRLAEALLNPGVREIIWSLLRRHTHRLVGLVALRAQHGGR